MGLIYGARSPKMPQKSQRQSWCCPTKLLLLHTAAGAALTRAGSVERSQLRGQHSNMDKASETGIFSPLKGHSKIHILMSSLRAGYSHKQMFGPPPTFPSKYYSNRVSYSIPQFCKEHLQKSLRD